MLLLREVLNRIQFRYNQAQLEELDDETLDDDVRAIDNIFVPSLKSTQSNMFTALLVDPAFKVSTSVLSNLFTIATDRVAKVPASESGGGRQSDGAAPITCVFYLGKRLSAWRWDFFFALN